MAGRWCKTVVWEMWNVETVMIWPHFCPKQSARSLHRFSWESVGQIIEARTLWCSGKGIQAMPGTQKTAEVFDDSQKCVDLVGILYDIWFLSIVIYSLYFMCKSRHTPVERWHGGPQQGLRVGINWRDLIVGILHLWPGQEITKEYSKTYSPQNASWSIPMDVLDPEREDCLIRFHCNLIQVFGTHETDASFQKKVFWTRHGTMQICTQENHVIEDAVMLM